MRLKTSQTIKGSFKLMGEFGTAPTGPTGPPDAAPFQSLPLPSSFGLILLLARAEGGPPAATAAEEEGRGKGGRPNEEVITNET